MKVLHAEACRRIHAHFNAPAVVDLAKLCSAKRQVGSIGYTPPGGCRGGDLRRNQWLRQRSVTPRKQPLEKPGWFTWCNQIYRGGRRGLDGSFGWPSGTAVGTRFQVCMSCGRHSRDSLGDIGRWKAGCRRERALTRKASSNSPSLKSDPHDLPCGCMTPSNKLRKATTSTS